MTYTDDNELSVELAAALVEDRFENAYEIKSDGSEGFTEEAQDLFNELQEIIFTNLTHKRK